MWVYSDGRGKAISFHIINCGLVFVNKLQLMFGTRRQLGLSVLWKFIDRLNFKQLRKLK